MEYKILNFRIEPHDLDEEMAVFIFDIEFIKPKSIIAYDVSLMLSFKLWGKIEKINPEFYKFYNSTRNSLDGFGPSEMSTIEAIGEEAIPTWQNIIEKVLLDDTDYLQRIYDHTINYKTIEPEKDLEVRKKAQELMKEWAEQELQDKEERKRSKAFCEKVLKQIRAVATEVYPEILNLEAKKLKEFKHLFKEEIEDMQSELESFLSDED